MMKDNPITNYQSPITENYFALFSLSPAYDLDTEALEQTYFCLQREYHPDRFAGRGDAEKLAATQQAMAVNEAYKILKDPLLRAEYLLSLQGIVVNKDGKGVKPTGCLLMEVMETREELSEADSPEAVKQMQEANQCQKVSVIGRLSKLFALEHWEEAAQETIRLRYLTKFTEEARLKLAQLK